MADNSIQISIEVIDKASSTVKNVADNIESNLNRSKKSILDFSTEAKIASVAFAATIGKVAADVVGAGAQMQQLSVAFETLTGSAEKSAEMMEFLKKTALESPLDFEEITKGTQRMLAYGFSMEEVKKSLPGLIDGVSALGLENGKLGGIILALGQMNSKQIVKQQEINQLQERGIQVTDMLAEAIRTNRIHVDGLSAGTITLSGATKKQTAAYEDATGSIGKLNAQIAVNEEKLSKARAEGKKSTAELNLMQTSLDELRAKQAKATGVISEYGEAHKDAGKKVQFAGASIDKIKASLGEVADMKIPGDQAAKVIMEMMGEKFAGAASKQMATLSGQMSNMKDVFQQTAAAIAGWSPEGVRAGSVLDILTKGLTAFNKGLQSISPYLVKFTDFIIDNKIALGLLAGVLLAVLIPGLTLALGPFVKLFIGIKTLLPMYALLGAAIGLLSTQLDKIIPVVKNVIDSFGGFEGVITTIKGKTQPLIELFKTIFERIKQIVQQDLGISGEMGGVVTYFSDMSTKVEFYSKRALQIIEDFYQKAKNFLAFGGSEGNASIIDALEGIWIRLKPMRDALAPLFEEMKTEFALTGEIMRTQVAPAFADLMKVLGPLAEALLPHIIDLIKGVIITITGIVAVILGIITGIATGLSNALPYIAQALEGVVQFIRGFVQIITGIINGDLGLVIEGFKQMFKGAFDAIVNTLDAILHFVSGFVQGVIGFFQGLYDTLVGHSIIPDMILAILSWFTKLDVETLQKIIDWVANIIVQFTQMKDNAVSLVESLVSDIEGKFTGLVSKAYGWGSNLVTDWISGIKAAAANLGNTTLGSKFKEMFGLDKMAHGGIVPGPIDAPIPIIAHGGERITPRTGVDVNQGNGGSMGLTINFNAPVNMDSNDRVNQLAKLVIDQLGRQNELARYGVGY